MKAAEKRRPKVRVAPVKASATVTRVNYVADTAGNCGPASLSMVFSHWGVIRTQFQIQAEVRADNSSWGMTPFEVPAYARSVGLRAVVAPRGNQKLVKLLISNGIPVIVNQWVSSSYRTLHYRPVVGYNNQSHTYTFDDPYLGAGYTVTYNHFRSIWQVRDRRFIVVFPPSKAKLVQAILKKAKWNYGRAYRKDLAWFRPQLKSPVLTTPGTWLNYNGYVEAAWTADQAAEYRITRRYLKDATVTGESSVLIGWIRTDLAKRIRFHH